MAQFFGDSPDRKPRNRSEYALLWLLSLIFVGLIAGEIFRDYDVRKLSIPFFLVSWVILLVVHEFGHALTARALGWRVELVCLGFGSVRWRSQWFGIPVEIRTFPISGFARPRPGDLIAPRLKEFLIYAAGPGVEVLLVLIALAVVGPQALMTASSSVGMIALQSFCVAALTGAIINLIPITHRVNDGGGGGEAWSDGLGMILCWSLPDDFFRAHLDTTLDRLPEKEEP